MIVRPDIHTSVAAARSAVQHRKETGCDTKKRYSSRKTAAAAASRRTRETGELISAYHCAFHHCFHIGHPPVNAAQSRERFSRE